MPRQPSCHIKSHVPSLLPGELGVHLRGLGICPLEALGLGVEEGEEPLEVKVKFRRRCQREKPGDQDAEGSSNSIYSVCGTRQSGSHI